jgi:hypothetical protein
MGRKERETMGHDVPSDVQLYMCSRRQCDDSFPEKKISFCFNHPHDPDMGSRCRKVGSLKDFQVRGVLKKEPASNKQKSCQFIRHGHLPKVLKQDGMVA